MRADACIAQMLIQFGAERRLNRDLCQHLAEITEVFLCLNTFCRFAGNASSSFLFMVPISLVVNDRQLHNLIYSLSLRLVLNHPAAHCHANKPAPAPLARIVSSIDKAEASEHLDHLLLSALATVAHSTSSGSVMSGASAYLPLHKT